VVTWPRGSSQPPTPTGGHTPTGGFVPILYGKADPNRTYRKHLRRSPERRAHRYPGATRVPPHHARYRDCATPEMSPNRGGPAPLNGTPELESADPGSTLPVVAVDAMGGDHGPEEAVRGAVTAVRELGLRVLLVGRRTEVASLLAEHDALREVPVVHAEDVLEMHEGALASWRRPRSSVAVACHLIRRGIAHALVSAGSTGGIVATATVRLRTQTGVVRPALAVPLPTGEKPTVLLDAGATADAKPEMLVQFAHLGSAYAQTAFGVQRPTVGLLTIGSEPGKGNKLARKAGELLTAAGESGALDFHGNI